MPTSNTQQFEEITEGTLADEVKDKHVLVLVHGYRNPLRNVAAAYKKLDSALRTRGLIGPGNYDSGHRLPVAPIRDAHRIFLSRALGEPFGIILPHRDAVAEQQCPYGRRQTHSLGARVALQASTSNTKPSPTT